MQPKTHYGHDGKSAHHSSAIYTQHPRVNICEQWQPNEWDSTTSATVWRKRKTYSSLSKNACSTQMTGYQNSEYGHFSLYGNAKNQIGRTTNPRTRRNEIYSRTYQQTMTTSQRMSMPLCENNAMKITKNNSGSRHLTTLERNQNTRPHNNKNSEKWQSKRAFKIRPQRDWRVPH